MLFIKAIVKVEKVTRRQVSRLRHLLLGRNWRQLGVRVGCIILLAVLGFSFLLRSPKIQAEILSQGPNSASATGDCTNDAGIGTLAWTSPGNAFSDNATYATRTVDGTTSNYIKCVNYNFSIPSNATIAGVVVGVERKSDSTNNGGSNDAAMRLVKGGTIGTADRSTATTYTTSDVSEDHGAPNDLWGVSLTPADVNGSTFGAAFAATKPNAAGGAHTVSVDHIRITVYYQIHAKMSTTGYIWENDDEDLAYGDVYDENTQQEAGNTALTNVGIGERMTLRMQIKNTGNTALNSNLGLFYDRNDGIWTKVRQATTASTATGSGCALSAWICTTIESTNDVGQYSSVAVDPNGNPWIAYYEAASTSCDNSPTTECSLHVAQYLGGATTGTGCASNTWNCTIVDNQASTGNVGTYLSLAIGTEGTVWISYIDTTNTALKVAQYLRGATSGTGCAVNTWTCTTVDTDGSGGLLLIGQETSITVDSNNTPWISYYSTNFTGVMLAHYLNGATNGSGCDVTTWDCARFQVDGNEGSHSSIAIAPNGKPWSSSYNADYSSLRYCIADSTFSCNYVSLDLTDDVGKYTSIAFDPTGAAWISYYDDTSDNLKVARYLNGATSGTGCQINTWTCTTVDSTSDVGKYSSIAFDPSGNPWISYYDEGSNFNLRVARYLGGATTGTGCAINTWTCTDLFTTNNAGQYSSIAFTPDGQPVISFYDFTQTNLVVAQLSRSGEIIMSPSQGAGNNDTLNESHAEMSSVSDTTSRDDADCIGGGTWNNGKVASAEEIKNIGLPAGDSTAQCTEIAFVIDTSQALAGTTYRFVVASKDSWRPDKGDWRGAISNDQYPTLTIASSTSYRYSKDQTPKFSDCTNTDWGCLTYDTTAWGGARSIAMDANGNPWIAYHKTSVNQIWVSRYLNGATSGSGCSSNLWTCDIVYTGVDNSYVSIAFDNTNTPWIAFNNSATDDLVVAQYLNGATTGTGCNINTWTCTTVDSSNTTGDYASIAFDKTGTAWVSYYFFTTGDLRIARYLKGATTGTGCAVNTWECDYVDASSNVVGSDSSLAIDNNGNPWISYYESPSTSCDNSPTTECSLRVARYLGGATNGTGCYRNTWSCSIVANPAATGDSGQNSAIAIDSSGNPWISYNQTVVNVGLNVAKYVGSGGTGCSGGNTEWTCSFLDNTATLPRDTSIAIDSLDRPWIAYYNTSGNDQMVARYVGTGGSGCSTLSTEWSCITVHTTNAVGNSNAIAFDYSGTPWLSTRDNNNGNNIVIKMHISPSKPYHGPINQLRARSAIRRSDGRYHATSGYSPRSTSTCAGTADFLGICGMSADDSNFDSITATNARTVFYFSAKNSSPASIPTVTWIGRSNTAPNTASTTGDIIVELYNHTTKTWDNLASNTSSSDCNTVDCTITAVANNVQQNVYYDQIGTDYWLNVRVWQYENTSSQTFKTDYFGVTFENTGSMMRHGNRFLNTTESGFDL